MLYDTSPSYYYCLFVDLTQWLIFTGISSRGSLDHTPSVFALAVKAMEANVVGIELSGNCVAVSRKVIVTAFHNIYDEFARDIYQCKDSSDEFLFRNAYNHEEKKDVVIRIFRYAVISRFVVKQDANGQEEFKSSVLLSFVEGDYADDWAMFEIVSGRNSYCGVTVNPSPADFRFLAVCPEERLPVAGTDKLKGCHFDIAFYKSSKDPEETLNCQRVEYSLITMFKPRSRVYRLQGALSFGSCGSPTINENGELVTIHLASLDSTANRQPKTRFCIMQTSGTKRAKLTNTNLKLLAKETDQHLETMYQEQYRVFDELSSIAESYTVYKEGFVLCKSALFMKLLKEHT